MTRVRALPSSHVAPDTSESCAQNDDISQFSPELTHSVTATNNSAPDTQPETTLHADTFLTFRTYHRGQKIAKLIIFELMLAMS